MSPALAFADCLNWLCRNQVWVDRLFCAACWDDMKVKPRAEPPVSKNGNYRMLDK